jgi:hypothetical protein
MLPPLLRLSLAAAITFAWITRAAADVIDGDWCFPDGRRFSIRGPEILTPAGTRTTGNYSRHHFSYVVPQSDPDPGKEVELRLMNENTVYLWFETQASQSGPPQVWHRCLPEVSEREASSTNEYLHACSPSCILSLALSQR